MSDVAPHKVVLLLISAVFHDAFSISDQSYAIKLRVTAYGSDSSLKLLGLECLF